MVTLTCEDQSPDLDSICLYLTILDLTLLGIILRMSIHPDYISLTRYEEKMKSQSLTFR